MTTPKKPGDDFKKMRVDEARRNAQQLINNCFDSLVLEQDRPQIPEDVFTHHFLPYFSGKPVDPKRNPAAEWIGVAGAPTAKVDVVDEQGNVKFTVPPMIDTSVIRLSTEAGGRLSDMMEVYNLQQDRSPFAAENYLHANLNPKVHELSSNKSSARSEAEQQWNHIFQIYGITNPSQPPAQADTKAAQFDDGSDDLVYD